MTTAPYTGNILTEHRSKSRYMPLVVMAAAVGLGLIVAVWGVLRVAALR